MAIIKQYVFTKATLYKGSVYKAGQPLGIDTDDVKGLKGCVKPLKADTPPPAEEPVAPKAEKKATK